MNFMLQVPETTSGYFISHGQKILSIGSCFTEHIGTALKELKFDVLQNPSGILFDPASVCGSLISYLQQKNFTEHDLFFYNELWHSWAHHSRFSGTDKNVVLQNINESQQQAYNYLSNADWLVITLGSAFSYRLSEEGVERNENFQKPYFVGSGVANCHRAPAQWFYKHMLSITEIIELLDNTLHQLFYTNRKVRIIFTISPVRHIRDGVIENNRSKARLIEAVHHMVQKFDRLHYFPSYELVIDVLRDYRYYAEDMVHPNYAATQFVLDHFLKSFTSSTTQQLIEEIKKIVVARRHKPHAPDTSAHRRFLQTHLEKAKTLQQHHPIVDMREEINYFSNA